MVRYFINRIIMIIPIIIGVTIFIFLLLSIAPGDPARIVLGSNATEEQLDMWREQNGLKDPLPIQYLRYMSNAVRGDFGISYATRQSVNLMIGSRVGNTLFLALTSMAFTIIVALFIGIGMALKQNSFFDNFMRVLTVIFTAMPQFWMALVMILLFTVNLGWLPSSGLGTFKQAIMPILCLAFGGITHCARTGRASIIEVLSKDYIRTARAKGLRNSDIIRRHVLKNAMLPMVSVYGRIISTCFGGSVVLESVFGITGIGTMLTQALGQKDTPAIMGSVIISACVITIVSLLTDLAYSFVDPRIRSKFVSYRRKAKAVTAND